MIDKHYKAITEAELYDEIPANMKQLDEDDNEILTTVSTQWAWDWNIPVAISPAVINDSGDIITSAVMSTEFHANLRLLDENIDVSELDEFEIFPNTPNRVFA